MKERPILFGAPMAQALLAGRKTQTRRIVKPAPEMVTDQKVMPWDGGAAALLRHLNENRKSCPYGQPGDRLFVRETTEEDVMGSVSLSRYSADKAPVLYINCEDHDFSGTVAHWDYSRPVRPSIHMRRWESRILLEVISVRVERLQDISEEDAEAEGIEGMDCPTGGDDYQDYWRDYTQPPEGDDGWPWFAGDQIASYRSLWESINGAGSWDANSWVWVIEFRRVTDG